MTPTRSDLSIDDNALVLMARNGDRDAFGELVRRHQRRVWMVCRQYVGVDEADAVAQDSLVKAYTSLAILRRPRGLDDLAHPDRHQHQPRSDPATPAGGSEGRRSG